MWLWLQSKWQSLIFRLLLYFLISMLALAVILAISFTQRLKPHLQNEILPNLERYIEYIIDDIGVPPDLSKARQLAGELPFEIGIGGAGIDWVSSPLLEGIDSDDFEPAPPPYDNVYFGHYRHRQYMAIEQSGYRYLFVVDNSFRQGSERRHGMLFLLVGLILGSLYFLIQRMFKPIQVISKRVEKIGEGDLEHSLSVTGKGELGLLAAGINRMSGQIKSMLESKSSLLLAISHELRSPMTRMRVNLELLEASKLRDDLIGDLHEMEGLVAAILESEKLNRHHAPLNLKSVDISKLIEKVIRSHPEHDRIKSNLTPVVLEVDEMRIRLLLKNLIDNACYYSPEHSEIDIDLIPEAAQLKIIVQDRGIGIAAAEIPRLSEAFYRPDSARQRGTGGYGLGLYLCRLIIEAHGGGMHIDSEPGNGTRVEVTLPRPNQ